MSPREFNAPIARLQHAMWKNKLITFLNGGEPIASVSHKDCALGKWLYEEGGIDKYGKLPEMQQLDLYHAQFHAKTKHVIDRQQAGDISAAWKAYEEVKSMSDEILILIDALDARIKRGV